MQPWHGGFRTQYLFLVLFFWVECKVLCGVQGATSIPNPIPAWTAWPSSWPISIWKQNKWNLSSCHFSGFSSGTRLCSFNGITLWASSSRRLWRLFACPNQSLCQINPLLGHLGDFFHLRRIAKEHKMGSCVITSKNISILWSNLGDKTSSSHTERPHRSQLCNTCSCCDPCGWGIEADPLAHQVSQRMRSAGRSSRKTKTMASVWRPGPLDSERVYGFKIYRNTEINIKAINIKETKR